MSTPKEYPFVNDWAKGCWVGRPNGKADRDYVYQREFVRGATHKATGMVRYTLEDLGGQGWVVACDRRRIRSLIRLDELQWEDTGETSPKDVLRVVQDVSWDGGRCDNCQIGVVLEDETRCVACERETSDQKAQDVKNASVRAHTADEEPF